MGKEKDSAQKTIDTIRRKHSAEEKNRIVMAGLVGVLPASRLGNPPGAAAGYEMIAIECAMIGGASLSGGTGSVGNCYDNSPMESFFGTLKTECATYRFASHAEAQRVIFEYLEVWYNRQRLRSAIGYHTPAEHELAFYETECVR
jgi:hypothetical protein